MRTYRPDYKVDGVVYTSRRWWIDLHDHRGFRRRLAGLADRRATEAIGRNIERLVRYRAAGEPPDPALAKWLADLPAKLQRALADIGLLAVAPLKALKVALDDKTLDEKKRQHIQQTFFARNSGLPAKRQKAAGQPKAAKTGMSGLDAAAKVLVESAEPLNAKQIVEIAAQKDYWSSTAATPWATIYAAMLIEARKKGAESRFVKVDRGLWTLTDAVKQAK